MKSYTNYMNSITEDELYKGLLVYGMFSDKLPPVFSMEDFWDYLISKQPSFSKGDHDFIYYESIKNNGIPRPFGIPAPMAYQRLCEGLKNNWSKLQQHFKETTATHPYKISRIHIRKIRDTEKIFEMNYKKWWIDSEPQLDLQIGAKYVVRSDISTCFPSIYSHSIPWALVGKDYAKDHRGNKEWFNAIDKLCCTTKNGETHGLLIGPHTSNLISEIILCAVDQKLAPFYKYVRNIDDYECYVSTYEEGEHFISDLNIALREYDLSLNRKKTCIEKLPIASSSHWVHQIKNAITIQLEGHIIKRKHIQSFLDTVIQLVDHNDDAAALKYAMRVIKDKELEENAVDYYIKTILHLSFLYPYIVPLLKEYVFDSFIIDREVLEKFINKLYSDAINTMKYEVLYYSLYFAVQYNFELDSFNIDDCLKREDCLFKFFSWLYCKQHKKNPELEKLKDEAKGLKVIRKNSMDRYWIYVYEALSDVDLNGEWKNLKRSGVSFLKPEYR